MSAFKRERPPARNKLLSLRVSEAEDALLDVLQKRLGLVAKVDVFRAALDYFVKNAPEAQPEKEKG